MNINKPRALLESALSDSAKARVTLIRKDVPEGIETPWVVAVRGLVGADEMNQIYYVIIPRARLRDMHGERLTHRDAFTRAEIIERFTEHSRSLRRFKRIDRLVRTPAPVSWDDGYDSPRRRYCVAHCAMCGLHFTSNAAFDEHAINEKHRHPSKIDKLVPVTGVDTGCYCMCTSYGDPACRHLPFYNQNVHHVPGVRLWEHIKAQTVREHFRGH